MKEVLFGIAVAIALYGYAYYGRETFKKTLRPRPFTWLIWGILSTAVTIVQLRHGAGLGAVGAALGAMSGYTLAGMAWLYGHRRVHTTDIISSICALFVLLLWSVFGDAFAVIAATSVYLVGFIPTILRGWKAPRHESTVPFVTAVVKHGVSIIILGSYSLETLTYPLMLTVMNGVFVVALALRRHRAKNALQQ